MKRYTTWVIWSQILLQASLPALPVIVSRSAIAEVRSPFSADNPPTDKTQQDSTLPYSATLAQGARMLAAGHTSDSARSLAVGAASGEFQQWLSQFGTARIQLDMDRHGSWGHSSGDLLVPLYDNQQSLLFVQGGIRKPSDRLTGNLGFGVRTFWQNGWMYGGNVFFDDDFTGHNRRVGIGGEAWRDDLRLSANTYVGTTDWHTSRDFDGTWQEKPADGWDVRAQGWLPAYPQLGAKLVWEQYYGSQVALFDKEHLQRNPHAVTAGVEYTPVPLVTLGVEQKQGRGEHDTQMSLGVHWSFGHDWRWQVDPDNVQSMRTLAGSRYDLVGRNNEIILQYRKNPDLGVSHLAVTRLTDNSPADGITRNVLQVLATNRNGQPVRNAPLNWRVPADSSASLLMPSSVTDENGLASVTLTSTKVQVVPVTAQSGNVSASQDSHFVAVAVSNIALAVTQDNAVADGSRADTVVATLTDNNHHPVAAQKVTWTVPEGVTLRESSSESDAGGKAAVHLTSTTAGSVAITATAGSQTANGTVHFAGNAASAKISSMSVTTDGSPADGKTPNVAQATVTDASGNILSGQTVTWKADKSTVAFGQSAVTDASGKTTVTYTDTTAEPLILTASLADGNTATASSQFVSDKDNARLNDFTVTSGATASGTDTNTATVTVTDANGNALAGTAVTFSVTGSAALSQTTANTDSNGKAQITLTDLQAETVQVTASLATGGSMTKDSTFVADPGSAQLDIAVTSGARADGSATDTATITLKDRNGKALPGQTVTLTASGSGKLSADAGSTDENGQVVVTLTSTTAENVTVTASLSNGKQASAQASFIAFGVTTLTTSATSVKADGVTSATLTATVKDASGGVVINTPVTFSTTGSAKLSESTASTNAAGQVQVALTDETEESVTVTAKAASYRTDKGQSVTVKMTEAGSISGIIANGHTFAADSGFPTTGFKGATFTLALRNGNPEDYNWSSSASWVSVSNGVVTFTGTGDGKQVTVTGTPKTGSKALTWSFTLNGWYINNGANAVTWASASTWCSSQSGYSMPTSQQLNGDASAVADETATRGTIGGLWSEWGDMSQYSGTGFSGDDFYWSSTADGNPSYNWHLGIYLSNGKAMHGENRGPRPDLVVCRKSL